MESRNIFLRTFILLLEMGSESFQLDTSSYCSLLHGFKESSYDVLADGFYAVHYDDKHKEYEMRVKEENGKRHGETIILRSGHPWMKLSYRNGKLSGPMEKMDESGAVVLQGFLEEGVEKGLFKEYTDSIMTWIGRYSNGRRYSEVFRNEYMEGFYIERCLENGRLLSIAQYDDALQFMEGYCIICVDLEMIEYVFKNGRARLLNRWLGSELENGREGGKRDHSEEMDSSKRIRFNPAPESNKDTLIRYDTDEKYQYGVWKEEDVVAEVKRSVFEDQVIEVDLKSHEVRVFVDGELKEFIRVNNDCIDLDANGRKWKGSVRNGKPFGYGVLYDEEGRREYEGFMLDTRRMCYGKEYYPDTDAVKYDGCYCEGKRFGKGVLYDRNGGIEHDGLWNKNEPYSACKDGSILDNHTESIEVPETMCSNKRTIFFPHWLHSLKTIVIHENCYKRIRSFVIDGLIELEVLSVGKKSFTETGDEPWDSERSDGVFRIVNCPKLEVIHVNDWAFSDYHSFEIGNLPALESLMTGVGCFHEVSSFSLTSLIDGLTGLSRPSCTQDHIPVLWVVQYLLFCQDDDSDLPHLEIIHLGEFCLYSSCDSSQRIDREYSLIMRNLPSLTNFIGEGNNCFSVGSILLENIPSLASDKIQLGEKCFQHTSFIKSSSRSSPLSSSFDADALTTAIKNCGESVKVVYFWCLSYERIGFCQYYGADWIQLAVIGLELCGETDCKWKWLKQIRGTQ